MWWDVGGMGHDLWDFEWSNYCFSYDFDLLMLLGVEFSANVDWKSFVGWEYKVHSEEHIVQSKH